MQSGRQPGAAPLRRLTAGGSDGNERLTVLTGVVLIVLLAALGLTIVRIGSLIWEHLFIGLLLIGPIALKLASTGYRFVRYYTGDPIYRRKGPPAAYLRALGPLVVLSTLAVFATGVALLALGPRGRAPWLSLHKVSFFVWLAATGLHVLGHLPELAAVLGGERTRLGRRMAVLADVTEAIARTQGEHRFVPSRHDAGEHLGDGPSAAHYAGRTGRTLALVGAVVAGLVLALLLIPEFGPWLHYRHGHVFLSR